MTLIEKTKIGERDLCIYDGLDFEIIKAHSQTGADGFMVCFVQNFKNETQSFERENKIQSLLSDSQTEDFQLTDLDNNFLIIYQIPVGEQALLLEIIKEKILSQKFFDHSWLPLDTGSGGAWRIRNSKFWN